MTCRIRAGEVARPHECGFTPRTARPGTSREGGRAGDPSCSGPPLLPIHFLVDRSSGRRQDSASARTAPPLRRGLVVSHGSCPARRENPNGTCPLCCYDPLARSGRHPVFDVPPKAVTAPGPATEWRGARVGDGGPQLRGAVNRRCSYAERGYAVWSVSTRSASGTRRKADPCRPALSVQHPQRPGQGGGVHLRLAAPVHQRQRVTQRRRHAARQASRRPRLRRRPRTAGGGSGVPGGAGGHLGRRGPRPGRRGAARAPPLRHRRGAPGAGPLLGGHVSVSGDVRARACGRSPAASVINRSKPGDVAVTL